MKLFLKIAVVLVVLLVIAGVGIFLYIDSIAKAAIEGGGSYALGVPTSLTKADVKVFGGEFAMDGLTVANPEGYESDNFLTMNSGGVAVSLGSLMADTVELGHLTLSGIVMNLEKHEGQANYQTIIENLKRFETADKKTESGEGKKFVIKEVLIEDVTVHVDLLGGGELTKLEVPIDEIRLTDVGSDSNKALMLTDLIDVIVKAIFMTAVNKGGSIIPADVTGELNSALASLQGLDELGIEAISQIGEVLGDLEDPLQGIGGDIEKAGGDITREIGNLLGGDKD